MSIREFFSQKHKGKKRIGSLFYSVFFIRLNGCPSGTNVCGILPIMHL